ncbi:MAG: NERD domain-containing protein, partial [Comamonas sp.]
MGPLLQTTLSSLWPLLALVAGLAVLGTVLRHPRVKGWRGERQVLRMIREGLNPHVYADLHNVTLPTEGGSTQIDHLIFSPYGLFVLETKNLQGWIFGSERQAEWTQKIHKNHSQKFQNPLRQNYKHTQTVQALLGLPAEQVHSVVAFVGDSQFKTEVPPQVLQGQAFIGYILQFQQPIWGPEEMQALIDRLEQHRLAPTRATHKAHAAHVQQLRADQAQAKAAQRTPAGKSAPDTPAEPAAPAVRPTGTARRGAPTPQQVAAAPLLQEVVARPAAEPVTDTPQTPLAAVTAPRTDDAA